MFKTDTAAHNLAPNLTATEEEGKDYCTGN